MTWTTSGDPLGFHVRVAGNSHRGWARVAAGVGLGALTVTCWSYAIARSNVPTLLTWLTCLPAIAGALYLMLGIDELRRPVRADDLGHSRDDAIRSAPLRWHPEFPYVVDEFERSTQRDRWSDDLFEYGARVRLAFDDAPLTPGRRATIRFHVLSDGCGPEGGKPKFRLRCLRESPRVPRGMTSRLDCLADLRPEHVTMRPSRGGLVFTMQFAVPPDMPGSDLLAAQPVYWEFEADSAGPRGPYCERFYVPVRATRGG